MKIILIEPFESGARPALQDWNGQTPPDGYAWCPNEFVEIFYSTSPAGFVDIVIENDTVTAMTVDQEAYNAYVAAMRDEEETDTGIDYDAVLLDHDYRLLCLETGLTQ